jgi:hypothetical protein
VAAALYPLGEKTASTAWFWMTLRPQVSVPLQGGPQVNAWPVAGVAVSTSSV